MSSQSLEFSNLSLVTSLKFYNHLIERLHTMSPAALTTASATLPSFAITTTFTAPTQCAQSIGGLTMLENDGFRIWLNAPLPVPGTTISSCYPNQFMSSFLLQTGGISQAPFQPLVCPDGYKTQGPYTSNYIACCPMFVLPPFSRII